MMSIISSSTKYFRSVTGYKSRASNDAHDNTCFVTNADEDIFTILERVESYYDANRPSVDCATALEADAAGQIAYDSAKAHKLIDDLAIEAYFTAQYNTARPWGKYEDHWDTYLSCRAAHVKCGLEGKEPMLHEIFPGLQYAIRADVKLTIDGLTRLKIVC